MANNQTKDSLHDRNPNYWQNKIAAWLYESPLKDFNIAKRDEVAKKTKDNEIFTSIYLRQNIKEGIDRSS